MKNYNCRFCTLPCKKDNPEVDTNWTCPHCQTRYAIDLYSEEKYHHMFIEETVIKCGTYNGVTDVHTPASKTDYLIKVDLIATTTTVYQLCKSRVRTKVLELPHDFTTERNISRPVGPYSQHKYDISIWLDYNLSKTQFPETPPAVKSYLCHSCKQECTNHNPRFNLYWGCKECSATYYLEDEPPHKIHRAVFTCERDENTNWCLSLHYAKNTTTLSYSEEKTEVVVLELDFVVTNIYAPNLKEWINKKLIFL